jgi:hypothetical protein
MPQLGWVPSRRKKIPGIVICPGICPKSARSGDARDARSRRKSLSYFWLWAPCATPRMTVTALYRHITRVGDILRIGCCHYPKITPCSLLSQLRGPTTWEFASAI